MEKIIENFLNGTDVNLIDFQNVAILTWDDQKLIYEQTVKHPILDKYPMKVSYCIAFLKRLVYYLETFGVDVHDVLYNHLCDLLSKDSTQEYNFKHFCIFDNESITDVLTIKESSKLISDGTTGLRSWEAATVLSQWCWQERNIRNKCLLELGSGAGLAGIFIAKFCQPAKVILSDCHEKVLDLLIENVKLNFPSSIQQYNASNVDSNIHLFNASFGQTPTILSVMKMRWEEVPMNKQFLLSNGPDYLLGADIVYDPELYDCLCSVIHHFLSSNTSCKVTLVNTIRNEDNYSLFLNRLDFHGLSYCDLAVPEQNKLHWNQNSEFKLISIYRGCSAGI